MEINIGVIGALIELNPLSMQAIADKCGIQRTNLAAALRGRRSLTREKVPLLLETLGVPNGRLDTTKVHFWNVEQDLAPLNMVVKTFFPGMIEIVGLWREGGGLWDMTRALDNLMLALFDERLRVIIKRAGLGARLSLAKPINPETVANTRWHGQNIGAGAMVAIPAGRYEAWQNGDSIDISEFDEVLGRISVIGWPQVLDMLEHSGLTPAEAVSIYLQWKTNE